MRYSFLVIFLAIIFALTFTPTAFAATAEESSMKEHAMEESSMKGHAMETPKGDAKAGETAFKKKKCTICHAFGKKKMGPDLNEISKRANAEWLTKWLTDDKKTWKSHDPITMDLKKRVGYDKQKQKLPKLKKSEVADLVQFLMTK